MSICIFIAIPTEIWLQAGYLKVAGAAYLLNSVHFSLPLFVLSSFVISVVIFWHYFNQSETISMPNCLSRPCINLPSWL